MSARGVVGTVLALAFPALVGCGADPGEPRVLRWWAVPDLVDARSIADTCNSTSDDYSVEIELLPRDVDQRRAEIVRKLSADDDSIDILSLDTSLTAEMASAGYLADVPAELAPTLIGGVAPKAIESASFDGRLVAAPWWLDPQVLWYRGTTAERAGLDTTKPVGWDDLLAGAERLGTTLQIDDPDGNGLADWIRALVAGASGRVLDGAGRDPQLGLASDAGRIAAGIVQFYAGAGVGPGPSADALEEFAGVRGGFLLASSSVVKDPLLVAVASDMRAIPYPVVESTSIAPLTGVSLAVPESAADVDLAYEAITCLASEESQQQMMIGSGHGAARASVYQADEVKNALAADDIALKALSSGVNVPQTAYWQRVRAGLRDTWTPLTSVSPATTPQESQRVVADLVAGGLR